MASMGNSMDQFENLTRMTIVDRGGFRSVQTLDILLAKCYHLEELELWICESSKYTRLDRDAMNTWLSNNVRKADTLKELKIDYAEYDDYTDEELRHLPELELELRNFGPEWIEYFCYKYPSIDTLNINSNVYDYKHIAVPDFGNVNTCNLTAWRFYSVGTLGDYIQMFKRSGNSIRIKYVHGYYERNIICEMDVSAHLNSAQFIARIPFELYPEKNTTDFISTLGTTNIDNLVIESTAIENPMRLSSCVSSVSSAKCAKISSLTIIYEDSVSHDLDLSMLNTTELNHVDGNPRSLTQLNKAASNMKNLIMKNCNFRHQIIVSSSHWTT